MVEISRDGKRVYWTNSLYSTWDNQFYPDGVPGAEVHKAVKEFFDSAGYKTGRHEGRMQGFFHGTGHGLGLEIHETPRLSSNSNDCLRAGHVVTVEPGLYYPECGGVRLEDVAYIAGNSPRNLTKFEKVLEL